MSFKSGKDYTGFDVELAQQVCALLGWTIQYQEIAPGNAVVELSSGNIDAAWGGMSFAAPTDESYSLSPVYMENELVLVSRTGSGIKSLKKLKGKVLYTTSSAAAYDLLAADEKTFAKIGEVVQSEEGAWGCLQALSKDLCDAVAISGVSADYYLQVR